MGLTEKKIVNQIRTDMWRLRESLATREDSPIAIWVVEGELACCQRPLRDDPTFGGRARALPESAKSALEQWADDVERLGIRSVICLSHQKELAYYKDPLAEYDGLLGLYGNRGWAVKHIPWVDPAHEKTREARERVMSEVDRIKHEAFEAFKELEKPVLMHCSAGIDRSPPVAAYIVCKATSGTDIAR